MLRTLFKNVVLVSVLLACAAPGARAQTFTFECKCEHVTGVNCDVCNANVLGRSFHGLLIKRGGAPYKWIDEPYTVRQLNGESIEFLEQIPNPDRVVIARFQTQFATMAGYLDSVTCFCGLGGQMNDTRVDTPIIGDGSPAHPLTIGQYGADTTMFLHWNGHHWYPAKIDFSKINLDLPYYTGDTAAIAGGLEPGDPYLLECANDYDLPAGIYKVVKFCGYDCAVALHYYADDAEALSKDVPVGKEYVLDEHNLLGILNGFVKVVTGDTLADGKLVCGIPLPAYVNDGAAIAGGLALGDHYVMAAGNTYGAPQGQQRVVSAISSTAADAQPCCEADENLPFFANNGAAIAGGLAAGDYYYLLRANTLGYPYGTKKRI